MLSVKQGGIKYHFWVFGMTRPGIELRSPGPLAIVGFKPLPRVLERYKDSVDLASRTLQVPD